MAVGSLFELCLAKVSKKIELLYSPRDVYIPASIIDRVLSLASGTVRERHLDEVERYNEYLSSDDLDITWKHLTERDFPQRAIRVPTSVSVREQHLTLKKAIGGDLILKDIPAVKHALQVLSVAPMCVELLRATDIGKYLHHIQKNCHNDEIKSLIRPIVKKWKSAAKTELGGDGQASATTDGHSSTHCSCHTSVKQTTHAKPHAEAVVLVPHDSLANTTAAAPHAKKRARGLMDDSTCVCSGAHGALKRAKLNAGPPDTTATTTAEGGGGGAVDSSRATCLYWRDLYKHLRAEEARKRASFGARARSSYDRNADRRQERSIKVLRRAPPPPLVIVTPPAWVRRGVILNPSCWPRGVEAAAAGTTGLTEAAT